MKIQYFIGFILCLIGGYVLGYNAQNLWVIVGFLIASFGLALLADR